MISWLVRFALVAAGSVVGLFVTKDAPGFDVIQMIVALFVIALIVFVLALWPTRWTHLLNRSKGNAKAGS